jgi:hypothetical protein
MFLPSFFDQSTTGEVTGTGPVAGVPGPAIVGPPKKPCPGPSHNYPAPKTPVRGGLTIACSEKPLSGVVSQFQNRRPGPGTGDRPVTGFWYFLKIRSVTMTDSDPDEEGSGEVSCQQQQNSEGDEDVEEVEASGSRASAKPILRLHVLMERRLPRTITHLSKTWSIRIF